MLRVMHNDWSPMYTIKWFDWWISDDVSIVSLLFCSWRFPLYEQKPLHSLNNIIRTWFSSHDQIILSMNIKINCHSSQDRITNDRHYFLRVIHFQYCFFRFTRWNKGDEKFYTSFTLWLSHENLFDCRYRKTSYI